MVIEVSIPTPKTETAFPTSFTKTNLGGRLDVAERVLREIGKPEFKVEGGPPASTKAEIGPLPVALTSTSSLPSGPSWRFSPPPAR